MDLINLINSYIELGNYRGLLSKINHNESLKNSMISFIKEKINTEEHISISEGIYRIYHKLNSAPLCKVCNINKVTYKNLNVGYFENCSATCAQTSSKTQDARKISSLIKYGVDHHTKRNEYKEYVSERCNRGEFGFLSTQYKNYLVLNNVSNVSQIPKVNNKIRQTIQNRTADENLIIKNKQKNTLLTKYGVTNGYELARKFIYHEYTLPSGKLIKLQGYEPFAISKLLETYDENDIIYDRKLVPVIKYLYEGKEKTYYPDFFIPKDNLIIEVKSTWTYNIKKDQNLIKLKAAQCNHNAFIWICSTTELLDIIK